MGIELKIVEATAHEIRDRVAELYGLFYAQGGAAMTVPAVARTAPVAAPAAPAETEAKAPSKRGRRKEENPAPEVEVIAVAEDEIEPAHEDTGVVEERQAEPAASTVSQDALRAVMNEVIEKISPDAAFELIKTQGQAPSFGKVDPANYPALYVAAKAKLAEIER